MIDLYPPLQFLLLVFAGWVNRQQLEVIDYLKEENRILARRWVTDACALPMLIWATPRGRL
ncbi:MAG: hypothetical protein ACREXM_18290 [Gammaproteobacteria bacterium]